MTGWLVQAAADVPPGDDWLAPAERAHLAGLRASSRRADWRLGRWTAKLAVAAHLGVPSGAVELRAAADGAPEALVDGGPAPVAVSLSHRAGLAVCMVAVAGTVLGCDLELAEPRGAAFVADWFTAGEREAVARARPQDRALLLAVLWSAKESALKALRVGLRFDTRWVVVDPPALGPEGRWLPLTVRHPAGARAFGGWWRHDAGLVLTMVAGTPVPAPGRLGGSGPTRSS
ncbi:MAG TPA: 4'-phosphopantetheinyl transferase superfamily protein [Actinomycetes bacterium]|nr:4'-phosphopantetheinyl transferase superfamily protein [Actinomycetes bacterium]